MKLTQKKVDELKLPDDRKGVIYWDDDVPGLGVRLQGKARRWVIRYRPKGRTKQVQVTLGAVDAIKLSKARLEAGEYSRAAKQGRDLAAEEKAEAQRQAQVQKQQHDERLGRIIERYLAHAKTILRPTTFYNVEYSLRVHWAPFHDRHIGDLSRGVIGRHLATINDERGGTSANRARVIMGRAIGWAMREGLLDAVETNPIARTRNPYKEESRSRILELDEIAKLWAVLQNFEDYGVVIKIALYTGQRRGEIGGMRWSELNLDERLWRLPAERTKNKKPHMVPLSRQVLELIERTSLRPDRDHLFGIGPNGYKGWGRSKERLDKACGVSGWRFHDLRRSAVTHMHEQAKILPHIVEAIVNHTSGHQGGIAGVYNRSTYWEERQQGLQSWADRLDEIVSGKSSKVIQLHTGVSTSPA